jgi:hypothetical protein
LQKRFNLLLLKHHVVEVMQEIFGLEPAFLGGTADIGANRD